MDADGIVIIRRQERSVNDVENVLPVVVPILGGQGRGDNLQLLHKAAVAGDLIGLLQGCGNCRQVQFFQRPQPGRTALPPGAGVGDVKDIPQRRAVSAVVHKGNSPRPAFDVPPHAVVPKIIRSTSRGVWPLSVNHELIQIRILIKPGGGLQKSRPSPGLPQLHRRMVGHMRVKFVFCGYGGSSLPFMVKEKQETIKMISCVHKLLLFDMRQKIILCHHFYRCRHQFAEFVHFLLSQSEFQFRQPLLR